MFRLDERGGVLDDSGIVEAIEALSNFYFTGDGQVADYINVARRVHRTIPHSNDLVGLVVGAGFAGSRTEATRKIREKQVRINGKVTSAIPDEAFRLSVGRRQHILVEAKS